MRYRLTDEERAKLEALFEAALASGTAMCGFCDAPIQADNASYHGEKSDAGELTITLAHRECAPTTQA